MLLRYKGWSKEDNERKIKAMGTVKRPGSVKPQKHSWSGQDFGAAEDMPYLRLQLMQRTRKSWKKIRQQVREACRTIRGLSCRNRYKILPFLTLLKMHRVMYSCLEKALTLLR